VNEMKKNLYRKNVSWEKFSYTLQSASKWQLARCVHKHKLTKSEKKLSSKLKFIAVFSISTHACYVCKISRDDIFAVRMSVN
jgi:hypothetical protein